VHRQGPAPHDAPVRASAPVRQLALALGVEIDKVRPSGPGGQVTPADVRHAATAVARATARGKLAGKLTTAAAVPTVTLMETADFEAVRVGGVAPLTAVAWACTAALAEHPSLNAWLGDRPTPLLHPEVHLGIATQTSGGLFVPVVRNAERLGVAALDSAIVRVTAAAKGNRAGASDLEGSTFTITNDSNPSLFATPLLNHPEVAILGLYRIEHRPVVRGGSVTVRPLGNLSLTFDHRAVDGADAGAFLARVLALLESWPDVPAPPST
jgi:2-oxoisovalerate dehydrogenase E2 component (dihydrolipoyl transacylase)